MRRVGWLLVGLLAGCDAPAPTPAPRSPAEACRLALERTIACIDGEARKELEEIRELKLERCEQDRFRRPEDDRATLACLDLSTCEEFLVCAAQIERSVESRPLMVDVARAIRSREIDQKLIESCRWTGKSDRELATLCEELRAVALAEIRRKLERERDLGTGPDESCAALEDRAGRISEEAGEEVRRLCQEVEAARDVTLALSEAGLAKTDGAEYVPASCWAAMRRLDQLPTQWAHDRRKVLVTACYVELGPMLLPKLTARRRCAEVEELYEHLAPRAAEDPALAKALAKAVRACPQAKGAK